MRRTYHLASPHSPAPPLPLVPSLCFNSHAGLINLLRPLPCPLSLLHPRFVSPFGPVQVQTLPEPEPDLRSGSLEVWFRVQEYL